MEITPTVVIGLVIYGLLCWLAYKGAEHARD